MEKQFKTLRAIVDMGFCRTTSNAICAQRSKRGLWRGLRHFALFCDGRHHLRSPGWMQGHEHIHKKLSCYGSPVVGALRIS